MSLVRQTEMNRVANATAVVATDGTSKTKVTITFKNFNGMPVPYAIGDLWLSDSAAGAGLTATTASGAVANDGTTGSDLGTVTTKKALRIQADATGKYALSITDTAKTAFKIVVGIGGAPRVVATLATANYG